MRNMLGNSVGKTNVECTIRKGHCGCICIYKIAMKTKRACLFPGKCNMPRITIKPCHLDAGPVLQQPVAECAARATNLQNMVSAFCTDCPQPQILIAVVKTQTPATI